MREAMMPGATMAALDIDKALREAFEHHVAGRLQQAEAIYRQVLSVDARNAEALHLLGVVAMQCGHCEPAIDLIRRAIAVRADVAEFHANLGNALKQLNRIDEALASQQAALRINPAYAPALSNLGALYGEIGRSGDAVDCFRSVIRIHPDSADAYTNLGKALTEQGRVEEALATYREAVRLSPDSAEAHGNLLFAMHYSDRVTVEQRVAEHRQWAQRHETPLLMRCGVVRHDNIREPNRRLRIGYLSPDLKEHPVSRFMLPVLERHDRDNFEIACYSDAMVEDDVSATLRRAADHWHRTALSSVEQLAALIRSHGVDILVDLAGHTGRGRLLALALSPAPVQATYLGYPGTTGMRSIQYRLSDSIVDPSEVAESQHSESLVRLDPCFLCYRIPPDAPAVAPPPAERNGFVTFGSFNNLAKISPTTLSLWRRILEAVPDARLLIKSRNLADAQTVKFTRRRIAEAGIDVSRVELLPPRKLIVDHLSAYGLVDVALDTFPYHGTTTTCEALAMGAAVVTLAGDGHASRVGASLLAAVGLSDLVASDESAYVRIAVELARDRQRLATLRRELRERLARSPLCDEVAFTRRLESAYRAMWRSWCESAPAAAEA